MNEASSIYLNFRQVSACKRLFRTGRTQDDFVHADVLAANRITSFLDLRNLTSDQIAANVKGYQERGIHYISMPVIDGSAAKLLKGEVTESSYVQYYLIMFETNINRFRQIFITLCHENYYNLLIGCNFGKDRTGVLVYLFLKILDIDESEIYADYVESSKYLGSCSWLRKLYPEKQDLAFNPTSNIIQAFDKGIMSQYGNKSNLARVLGLTYNDIVILKGKHL